MMQEKQLPSFAFNLTLSEDKTEMFENTKTGTRKKKRTSMIYNFDAINYVLHYKW